jgi:hypothetical protein
MVQTPKIVDNDDATLSARDDAIDWNLFAREQKKHAPIFPAIRV